MKKLLFLGLVALFALSCGDDDVGDKKKANTNSQASAEQKLSITTCDGKQKELNLPFDMVEVKTPSTSVTQFDSDGGRSAFDKKYAPVTLKAYYVSKYETTNKLWQKVYAWAKDHGYKFQSEKKTQAITAP
ncbi:MAG: hypothetical protein ACTTIC_07015 [Helicobacteraceae bacterium]